MFDPAPNVCGVRVNFVSPQSWGETTAHMLVTLAHRVARLGWHVQVFVQPEQLVALEPVLGALPVPLVEDHLGRIDPAEGMEGAAHAALRRLLDGGNTWVKLSGAYMRSSVGGQLADAQRYVFRTHVLAQNAVAPARQLALANRKSALQVGQCEVGDAVAAIGGTQQREECVVLADGNQPAVAQCPVLGGIVARKKTDFSNICLAHGVSSSLIDVFMRVMSAW